MRIKNILASVATFALPFAAFAQTVTSGITSVTGAKTWLTNVGGLIQSIFFIIAIIVLLYAAFLYLTASGDEEKVEKAKKMLVNALIAAAIAILAFGIQAIATGLVGTTTPQ